MALFETISEDIKAAMKARDKVRLDTLRNIKKVFLEAKTAPGANDTLEDADAMKILQKLAKQGHETADTFIAAGRQDLADVELAQAKVIEEYLPKPLTEAEIEEVVKAVIAETGASTMTLISMLIIIYGLYEHFIGKTIEGWTSLMVSMWFIGGVITTGVGITGTYIGKIYNEVKRRPRYFIDKKVGIKGGN